MEKGSLVDLGIGIIGLVVGVAGLMVGFYQIYIAHNARRIIREWGMDIRRRISSESQDLLSLAEKVKEMRPDELRNSKALISDEVLGRHRAATQIRNSVDSFLTATRAVAESDFIINDDRPKG